MPLLSLGPRRFPIVLALAAPLALAGSGDGSATHDAAYWRAIIADGYAVPEGESAARLIGELSRLLGSPDPEERDTFAYGIPAHWIYRQRLLDADELRALTRAWSANLRAGIGASGDDSVLLRSFSALDLSVLAALDNERPFLGPEGHAALLDAALDYLAHERDLRGYVPGRGWCHSVAHTADLLKFLARSRHLRAADQPRILDAVAAKLEVGEVYVWGEDERLAAAVLSLVRRPDLDTAALEGWLGRLAELRAGLWDGPLDPARFAAAQNGKLLLRALFVSLSALGDDDASIAAARSRVLQALTER